MYFFSFLLFSFLFFSTLFHLSLYQLTNLMLPVHLESWSFAQSFLNVYTCHTDIQSHLNSIQESRMSSKTPWRTLWRLKGEFHLPVHLENWNFTQNFLNIYKCHYWCPKSSRPHSGIRNVLQNSLEDALEKKRRISSSCIPRGLKFCTEPPECLYISFLTSIVI